MSDPEPALPRLDRVQRYALITAAAAMTAAVIGAVYDPAQFFRAYLFSFIFWLQIALGCFGVLMLYHLVGGTWGLVIERVLEAGALTLPLLAVLFVPVLIGMNHLYVWSVEPPAAFGGINHKSHYLQGDWLIVRAAIYFLIWSLLSVLLAKWSAARDSAPDDRYARRLQAVSGPGLVLFVLTTTFAGIDWMMSLEPDWYSTAYGFLMICASGLSGMALAIVTLSLLARDKPLAGVIAPEHFHDLGNLLLTFLMLWMYISFTQFLIIWSGNIPEEVVWYVHRSEGGWEIMAYLLVVLHFIVPFLLLLSRRVKRKVSALRALALGILFLRMVDTFWLVMPAFHPGGVPLHWMNFVLPPAIGGLWLSGFVFNLKARPLLPHGISAAPAQAAAPVPEAT